MSARKQNRIATLLHSAARQIQGGQLDLALESCERALELAPRDPDATHLRGLIDLQTRKYAQAVDWLQRAVSRRADNPAYWANLAYGYLGLDRVADALDAFQRAARLDPADAEVQVGLGGCLGTLGRVSEAETVLRRLVERHPRFAPGWFNLGKALDDQRRFEEACAAYRRSIEIAPRFAQAHGNLGLALHAMERYEEAEAPLRTCLAGNPGVATAHVNLAITLNALRRYDEGESLCRAALGRNPAQPGGHAILAKSLAGQGRWREALEHYRQAALEEPDSPALLGYLADALARNGSTREALALFERALDSELPPAFVQFNKAVALLGAGRIRDGMVEYAHREFNQPFVASHADLFARSGMQSGCDDATVCLLGEQGIGDEIFFLRYAPQLRSRGYRVTYHGSEKLTPLLARSGAFERTLSHAEPYARAARTLFVGDLPVFLDTIESSPWRPGDASRGAAPAAASSAEALPFRIRAYWPQLPPPLPLAPLPVRVAGVAAQLRELGPAPHVGVTWRAGTTAAAMRGKVRWLHKEIPLEQLATVLRGAPGTLVSLQRHPLADETERLSALCGRPVHDLSPANDDLEAMLALAAVLDDYVGVSNTNMHLRASVGRTARVLVPWPAEWRWGISGDESPWFPGFRIYRQQPDGDWGAALARLAGELAHSTEPR